MNPKLRNMAKLAIDVALNNNSISLAKLSNNAELSYEPNVKLTYAMIARLPTHKPRKYRPASTHLSLLTHACSAPHLGRNRPHLRNLTHHPRTSHSHARTPLPTNLRINCTTAAHLHTSFSMANGAVLTYEQIVATMPCECFYGGIRGKSIEFFQKVYRVFRKSL